MKTKKRLLSILLSLAMILGLMPGMSMTAFAESKNMTLNAVFVKGDTIQCGDGVYFNSYNGKCKMTGNVSITKINPPSTNSFQVAVDPQYEIVSSGQTQKGWSFYLTNYESGTATSELNAFKVIGGNGTSDSPFVLQAIKYVPPVAVTNVTLPATATLTMDGDAVALTAAVEPSNATDKKVKWSVSGSVVTLYSDAACTAGNEVTLDTATETLTVYARGMSAGTATVKVESNADSTKSASCNVTVDPITYAVTYKVVNGTWSNGEKEDITEYVASENKPTGVPTGMKAADGYTGGAWDKNPSETTITGATTFTYTFTAKQPATVTKAPEAKTLTYTGSAQALVNAGTATGGEMQYALGSDNKTAPTSNWSTAIPKGTEAGIYYVWYKVVGDDSYVDSEPVCITVTIESESGNGVEETKNPDGSRTVTEVKETKDGTANITVTNYNSKDEQISQYVFKQTKGTELDLKNVNSKNLKTVVVPESVKANGNTYKVTRIRKGFLKNCKQATKVDISKNINTIDKNAFNYGKKVKNVVIRGKLKKVGKGAFKNTKKNVVIKVKTNAKNFEKNKTLLEKSGLPKNATVKRVKNKK